MEPLYYWLLKQVTQTHAFHLGAILLLGCKLVFVVSPYSGGFL